MPQRRKFARVQTLLALFGILSAFVIYGLATGWNPIPGIANWFEDLTIRHLSSPRPVWVQRTGNEPDWASVLPGVIVVGTQGQVEARDAGTGKILWQKTDSWAAVAGTTVGRPVVIVGRETGAGFDVYDATSGELAWPLHRKAGVWAYANMVLVLTCADTCKLTAYEPDDEKPLWTAAVPGSGATLMGYDQALAQPVPVASAYASPLGADPPPAPPYVGLPMDGNVEVVATDGSGDVRTFASGKDTRTIVAGTAVVASTATERDGNCYFTVAEYDARSGTPLHHQTGLDLRTASECDTRHNPGGAGQYLVGRDASGRDLILDAQTGKTTYRADPGARIIAMDAGIAIVRSDPLATLTAVRPADGSHLWDVAGESADLVGVTPGFVLSAYPVGNGSITAYDRETGGTLLRVTSTATVLGVGGQTVVINIGRSIGPLLASTTPVAARSPAA